MSRGQIGKGCLGGLPSSMVVLSQGACADPAFAPSTVFAPRSSEVAVGLFGSFRILLSIICPKCATHSNF